MIRAVPIGCKERLADPFYRLQKLGARAVQAKQALVSVIRLLDLHS
jgi:hypothetical protein